MTTKILCWLENFSTHFAIMKGISDKTDYEIYGIINVNEKKVGIFEIVLIKILINLTWIILQNLKRSIKLIFGN